MQVLCNNIVRWTWLLIVFLLISSNFVLAEDLIGDCEDSIAHDLIDNNELATRRETKINDLTEELELEITSNEFIIDSFAEDNTGPQNSRSARTDIVDEDELGYDFGGAPSSGYLLAKSNLPLIIRGSTTTTISGSSDQDWFRINLDTDEANDQIDNLTITINSVTRTGGYSVHEVLIPVYGPYDDGALLLRADNYKSGNTGITFAHSFITGTYYFGFVNTFQAISYYGDYTMFYNITVEVESITQVDNNQIRTNADPISGHISNQTLDMDTDLFDWYVIDSPDPDNYTTNVSLKFEITDSAPVHYDPGITPAIDFYTAVYLLILHEMTPGNFETITFKCNKQHKFGLESSVIYNGYTTAKRTYIGLYVQVYGRNREGGGEGFQLGNDFMNGWVEYRISKISALAVIPPFLSGGRVIEQLGKTYLTYIYNVTYFDPNNDPPVEITVTINDSAPVTLKKRDVEDKNYTDGCVYEYLLDGVLLGESSAHIYRFFARDKENDALGDINIRHYGPVISNNLRPYIRDSAPTSYSLLEDCGVRYWSPNSVFEDADGDKLYFTLWNEEDNEWSNKYTSENITITSQNNGSLKFKPQLNMYNRIAGTEIGNEVIRVNATDTDPTKGFDPRHYVSEPWELEVIITSVNDAPKINRSFTQLFYNSKLVIDEDTYYNNINLNDIFHDPVEHDPLVFTNVGNDRINIELEADGALNITPQENWFGAESVTFYADDGEAQTSDTLIVIVEPINDHPILNHTDDQTAYEGRWFNYTFSGYDPADGDILTFSTDLAKKLGLAKSSYNFDKTTGKLSFKAPNKAVGVYDDINVSVTDESGGFAYEFVTFKVVNTPDPPTPTIESPRNNDIYLPWSKIDFRGSVTDPDQEIPNHLENFEYSWKSDIYGLIGTTAELKNQTLSPGHHVIEFEVSDTVYYRNITIEIEVLEINTEDSDEDGIYDWWEIFYSLNQFDPRDANEDPDNDRYTNLDEFLGNDGKPPTKEEDDDTHPWDRKSHPSEVKPEDSDELREQGVFGYGENFDLIIPGLIFAVLIIILLFSALRKLKREEEEAVQELEDAEVIGIDKDDGLQSGALSKGRHSPPELLLGKSGKIPTLGFALNLQTLKCHNCGKVIDILNETRPLVITCPECETRGVVY